MPTVSDADESIGLGTVIEIDDNGNGSAPDGTSFANVANVLSIVPPAIKTNTTESKRLGTGRIRKVATIEDGGSFTIKQQFTHDGYARMESIRSHKYRCTYRLTIPDDNGDTVVEVVGILTENKTDSIEADKITEFESTIEVAE